MLAAGIALALVGPGGCSGLEGRSADVVVTKATTVETAGWRPQTDSSYKPLPVQMPLCRVEGTIEGNIGFELWLPARWNGRLLGAGVGGDAGVFNYADMSIRVNQGFATVTTDAGHKKSQTRWMADRKARVDYEHRAVHLTAEAAKALIRRFYGDGPSHSYFLGCSGGGREALKEMQNYPGDYDGVVAGAPGPYMPLISVRMLWFALEQKHHPEAALADADWALYERTVTRACDRNDGVEDGIIEDPLSCTFALPSLLCAPGQTKDCLSAPKLAMLRRIVAPMPDELGRPMDDGLLPGVRTRPGPPSPLLRAMWADAVYNDPNWDEETFQRTRDLAAANAVMPELRADRTDIAPFLARGGKAIIYQGWADPSVIALPTIDYYARLTAANGGAAALEKSVRLFMVPGMYHCRGGPGADAFGGSGAPPEPEDPTHDVLWSLIRWVEAGEPPRRIEAAKLDQAKVAFSRLLCPFPESAVYDGKSDPKLASSYACKTDALLMRRLAGRR